MTKANEKPIRLAIALPAYNSTLDVGHAAMWLGVGAALAISQDKFTLVSFANYSINGIDLCRNTYLVDALNAGAEWCLSVDHDTYHHTLHSDGMADAIGDGGVDILQAIRDADRYVSTVGHSTRQTNNVALVGAPVRGRGIGNPGVCVQVFDKDTSTRQAQLEELQGQITEVARIGGALTAINLNWLREHWPSPHPEPWFQMHHDYSGPRPINRLGEDYHFCDNVYKRGGIVLCDGRFVPEHVDRRRLVGQK